MRIVLLCLTLLQSSQLWGASTCSDSDSGIDPIKAGHVTFVDSSGFAMVERDYCKNTTAVIEMYCENHQPRMKLLNCPPEHVCKKGACEKK